MQALSQKNAEDKPKWDCQTANQLRDQRDRILFHAKAWNSAQSPTRI